MVSGYEFDLTVCELVVSVCEFALKVVNVW